jgi:cysteine-rich repeat protein
MKKMIVITTLLLTACYEPLPSYISDKACYPMHSSPYSVACADKDFDNDGVKNANDDFPYNKDMSSFKNKEKACDCNEGYFCNQNGECELLDNYHEICDAIDNDKDGKTDENIKIVSPNLLGVCKGNLMICQNGILSDPVLSSLQNFDNEICDNLDNDCDGRIDEDIVLDFVMDSQHGQCQGIRYICDQGRISNPNVEDYTSYYEKFESAEMSCDNEDNDCDGKIDENLLDACGNCKAAGKDLSEICNGIDDDCDNIIDENTQDSAICGDGLICGNEECDNELQNKDLPNYSCRSNCQNQRCGDGILDNNEACDDGNSNNEDLCRNNCTINCNKAHIGGKINELQIGETKTLNFIKYGRCNLELNNSYSSNNWLQFEIELQNQWPIPNYQLFVNKEIKIEFKNIKVKGWAGIPETSEFTDVENLEYPGEWISDRGTGILFEINQIVENTNQIRRWPFLPNCPNTCNPSPINYFETKYIIINGNDLSRTSISGAEPLRVNLTNLNLYDDETLIGQIEVTILQ